MNFLLFTKEENCSTTGENLTNLGRGIQLNFNSKLDLENSLTLETQYSLHPSGLVNTELLK
jgi:hypothetical protein